MIGFFDNVIAIIAIASATFGFYLFKRYPSKIFWGVMIIMQGFIVSGFIGILI